jgi:hypothetical protein
MKITICGPMLFSQDMLDIQQRLEAQGHSVTLPEGTEDYMKDKALLEKASGWGTVEGAKRKISKDLIRKHYQEIVACDAVLIINKDKNGIKNYIGGNSFLEMGFAYILNKSIYLLNSIPQDLPIFYQEVIAMKPIELNGDISRIK